MHEPTYRQAISHSWKLAWHHKSLWFFGFLAAFLGQMGVTEILGKMTFPATDLTIKWHWYFWAVLKSLSNVSLSLSGWVWLGWLLLVIFALSFLIVALSVISQGTLIHASAQWAKNEKLPDVEKSWHAGSAHFWRLLFLNILRKVVIALLVCFMCWVVWQSVLFAETAWSLLLVLLAFVLAALVGMFVSFLCIYIAGYVVVENYPLSWALPAAWRMFCKHWLVSFEVGLIVLGLNVLISLVAILGLLVLSIPTFLTWFVTMLAGNSILWFLGSVISPFLFVVFIVWLGSVFTVFNTSVWTYLFMKMHKVGIVSRIAHIFRK